MASRDAKRGQSSCQRTFQELQERRISHALHFYSTCSQCSQLPLREESYIKDPVLFVITSLSRFAGLFEHVGLWASANEKSKRLWPSETPPTFDIEGQLMPVLCVVA